MAKVKQCIIFANGNVASFDEKGEQISECQGFILDIAEKLKECCDENTKWKLGEFGRWTYDADLSWYWEKKKREQKNMNRKYIIESRRFKGEDGKTTFDSWITNASIIEVKHEDQYLVFFPLEGEFAGKKHYIPFSNIHIVREL